MNSLGDRVKSLRKKERLTQEELGAKVHRSHGAIASIERGATAPDDVISALAKHFKVSEEWLRTGEGTAPKGLILPIRKELAENPWKDALVMELQKEITFYQEIIRNLTGGTAKGNFLKALRLADGQEPFLSAKAA